MRRVLVGELMLLLMPVMFYFEFWKKMVSQEFVELASTYISSTTGCIFTE